MRTWGKTKGQYKRSEQLGVGRWSWTDHEGEGLHPYTPTRPIPRVSPWQGRGTSTPHIPSGPNDNCGGHKKTRESVPPTGQCGQGRLPVQGPGPGWRGLQTLVVSSCSSTRPSPQPGLREVSQTNRPFARLALGRVCGASPSLESNLPCAPTAAAQALPAVRELMPERPQCACSKEGLADFHP